MNKDVESFFDDLSTTWDKIVNNRDYNLIQEIINVLPIKENDKILDLGCGTGAITSLLQKKSNNIVVGIDISKKMILHAKKKNKNKNVVFKSQDYYLFDDNNYDLIVCFDAYPHFININEFVNKSYQLLKNNGFLAIIFDINLDKINKCHRDHDLNISRQIKNVDEEYQLFKDYFDLYYKEESKNKYIMILQKNKLKIK